ncbi:WS/DGAT/MGAT family O-acyltransferase [Pseudomonas sp. URMO17WK12:I11]|uniref:WS/DGAT/MGAT family O-acyltransferase n=1 Tax=Pseudomonas sp. URMO17WK12:I11 TaxID=1283291 RepID=UPI00072226EB|nr:wax ester/triacylglycerol synthase family O-acyltransferase [Pseudomonas sp. URMO17WK12:I11]CRL51633.1 Putative diacylglycerol O-acyltransferasec/MT3848 [Pseudomonas sp. URMO17WK12:I11]
MNHLSGMDAMFLHLESAEMPMHIGGLHVLELPAGQGGDFFEEVKACVAQRLHLAAVFNRKLANMPFDLSNPVWVDDEDIDLDHHVRHFTLPKPGSNRQLQQAIARLHSSLLDRSRPLWELYIIDGLKSGEVALYTKLHHAGVDGQAGMEVGRALFDMEPSGRKIRPPRPKLRRNQYQLGVAELMGAALFNGSQQCLKLVRMLPEMGRVAADLVLNRKGPLVRQMASLTKTRQRMTPRTPFNEAITNQRSFAGRTVPLAEIKQIAKAFSVSLNDVVMATVAGTLRRYLSESRELPSRSMSAAVPASLRELGDDTANNQVSVLIVDLATDEADPLVRLQRISASATQRKDSLSNYKSLIPTDFPILAAPWLISGAASLYGRSRMANWMPPPANLVISNVAGIPVPLYFAGAKVISYYPVSIPCHGMALNVTVASYNGRMDYGLIACRRTIADLNELGDYLLAEHRLLFEMTQGTAAEEQYSATCTAEAPVMKNKTVRNRREHRISH